MLSIFVRMDIPWKRPGSFFLGTLPVTTFRLPLTTAIKQCRKGVAGGYYSSFMLLMFTERSDQTRNGTGSPAYYSPYIAGREAALSFVELRLSR